MEKKIICPKCKREFNLPDNFKPIIITEDFKEKEYFICPCCRNRVEVANE